MAVALGCGPRDKGYSGRIRRRSSVWRRGCSVGGRAQLTTARFSGHSSQPQFLRHGTSGFSYSGRRIESDQTQMWASGVSVFDFDMTTFPNNNPTTPVRFTTKQDEHCLPLPSTTN
ncbi:hypothetical protein E2542_SST12941 [Spatholobus suberectus]|nr:hypothetical protein E2542_SST12941 [Spatholobus suberectus]